SLQKIGLSESEIAVNVHIKEHNQSVISMNKQDAKNYLEIESDHYSTEQLKDWVTDKIVLELQEIRYPESDIVITIIE
ncbi:hypothetical protein, partial [Xenorhabdus innexi]